MEAGGRQSSDCARRGSRFAPSFGVIALQPLSSVLLLQYISIRLVLVMARLARATELRESGFHRRAVVFRGRVGQRLRRAVEVCELAAEVGPVRPDLGLGVGDRAVVGSGRVTLLELLRQPGDTV